MAKKKLNVPEILKGLEQVTTMSKFLDRFGFNGFAFAYNDVQFRKCESFHFEVTGCNCIGEDLFIMSLYGSHTVVFVDDNLNPWSFELTIEEKETRKVLQNRWGIIEPQMIHSPGITIKSMKPVTKLITGFSKLETDQEILGLIRSKNHYVADYQQSIQ